MSRALHCTVVVAWLAACANVPTLVPEQPAGQKDVTRVASDGVTLEVVANAWRDYPSALAEQLTPLWVYLTNESETGYDITYGTLQLLDEQGHLYAALPPLEVVRMLVGSQPAPQEPLQVAALDSDVPLEVAQFGVGFGVGPDPMCGPQSYSPYGYPASSSAANAILSRALREGRLLPHTKAAGFVYFQRAYAGSVLTLRLEAPAETPGAPPLLLETRFVVQR